MQSADHILLQGLRRGNYADYLAALFAPAPKRPAVAAVYAFRHEIKQIAGRVKEPLLAEMRLHYWQAGLEAALGGQSETKQAEAAFGGAEFAAGETNNKAAVLAAAFGPAPEQSGQAVSFARGQSPLMKALAAAGRHYDLPPALFSAICAAAAADISQKTPPAQAEFERHCAAIYGGSAELACRILAANILTAADLAEICRLACRHGGIARGIAALACNLPQQLKRQNQPIPANILAGIGLTPPQIAAMAAAETAADEAASAGRRLSAALAAYFHQHYKLFKQAQKQLPASLRPAFLPLAVLPLFIRRIEQAPGLLFTENTAANSAAEPSLLRRQGRILAAALFNRF